MLKPSIKSLEGQSFISIVATCIGLLYLILVDSNSLPMDVDEVLKNATTVKQIAEAYVQESRDISEVLELGKLGAVLVFIYKLYSKFTDSRTKLKKEELTNP